MPSFVSKPWRTVPVKSTLVTNFRPRRLALAGACLALLSACGSAGTSPAGSEPTPAQTSASQEGPEALIRMGDFARQRGDLASAVSMFRQAHAANPQLVDPLIHLGGALAEGGELEQSAGAFRSALSLEPDNVMALRGLGNAQIGLGQPAAALDELQAALAYGEDPNLLSSIGVAQDQLGRHAEARSSYGRALALAPGDLDFASNLALSKSLSGSHGEAISDMRVVAAAPTATARHRYNLALVLYLAGDVEGARSMLSRDMSPADANETLGHFARWRAITDSGARAAAIGGGV